jgi:vesicle-associated membrane protein 7
MASEFNKHIEELMTTFSQNPPADPIKQAQEEIGGVKQIMVQNIEQILARGERIELLVDKTDNMSHQARAFRKRSQALRRRMWWRNTKLIMLSGTCVVIILFLLIQNVRH